MGPETKKHCAGEDQQQFTGLLDWEKLGEVTSKGNKGKGEATPVTGLGSPLGCETSRRPHFLDNRLTDGCKFVSLKRWLPFTLREVPGTHFC
jgi:hypothetical protein